MRIPAYFLFYFFARHLPRSYELGAVGRLSQKLRYLICRYLITNNHGYFRVERGADFGSGKNIVIDEFGGIGENARFMGYGTIKIGKHVMMGPDVMIITSDHKFATKGFEKGYISKNVEIDDYVWIGARAIILKGVKIGKHAVVGAGAVVTKDVPDHAVVGGSPARILRHIKE